MSYNFFAKTGFLVLTLGTIATSSLLKACSMPQTQTSSPTGAGAQKPMDHNNMNHGGMNHGNMDHGGMNHSTDMALGPADADFDLRFIDAMTPHHQGAVTMAKEAQQKSKRPEIQKLATDIINAQDKELKQMKQWRQAWYSKAGAELVAFNSKNGKSMPMSQDQRQSMMMSMNLGAADDQFDLRFLNGMIPHHEGAVVMAQDALSKSEHPEIKKLAQEIIASQNAEIKRMQQWKQAWYGK
ncbi:MAG TPA: DUF305 domain-containing protein [Thermosynechococcaceae cyanobacterium]